MDGTTGEAARVSPDTGDTRVVLDGRGLGLAGVVRLADADAEPAVAPEALERAARSWRAAARLATGGRLYGRGTGVGAHRSVPVDTHDETEHGLRLLRSHAGGAGALVPVRQVRAMLAIRANQLLAGGSGIQPAFVTALAEALRLRVHPAVSEYGGLGTGDLTALAQTGLTLMGEHPWHPDTDNASHPDATSTRPGGPTGPAVMPGQRQGDGDRPEREAALAALPAQWRGEPGGTGADQATVTLPRQWRGDEGAAGPGAVPAAGLPAQWRGADGEEPHPATGPFAAPADRPGPEAGATSSGTPARATAHEPPPARERGLPAPTPSGLPAPGVPGLPAPVRPGPGDALALLSSNALTLGQAALACHDLDVLLRAGHAVAALSLEAVSGSADAYAAEVHALRPYPGVARAAAEVRRLLGPAERPGARVQDPFGFRAFPQAHGPALDAADALRRIVEVEANCPSENPLIAPDGTAAYHHGGFYAAPLGLALDALNLAVLQTAQLSAARLAALGRPGLTGLPAFLAAGPAGSSGTMILEYTANSALAELRSCAAPASAGHAVLSHGLEEAASFASQAARQSLRAVDAYATVLACELVSAVRALRLRPGEPHAAAFAVADAELPAGTEDRPLTADVTAAAALLRVLAGL
ncbi:aromatic amino acid lyase [Streptomyces anandii]|uniref:aromatic amino acid lyase n=1 Tax=Streptomyces anandii TaxID=285454 RepID=UPI0036F9E39B